jgi:hypothetical protein
MEGEQHIFSVEIGNPRVSSSSRSEGESVIQLL